MNSAKPRPTTRTLEEELTQLLSSPQSPRLGPSISLKRVLPESETITTTPKWSRAQDLYHDDMTEPVVTTKEKEKEEPGSLHLVGGCIKAILDVQDVARFHAKAQRSLIALLETSVEAIKTTLLFGLDVYSKLASSCVEP